MISKKTLKEIDEDIVGIIIDINKLFFVKQTYASCSGHIEDPRNCPYVDIEYKLCEHNLEYIEKFDRRLQEIDGCAKRIRKGRIHHYAFVWDGTKDNLEYIWTSVSRTASSFLRIFEPKHNCP